MNYDILSIHEKSSTVTAAGGKISAFKNSEIQRYGVRRFEQGKMFQTSRLGEASIDRLLADSKEWGGPGTPHEFGFAPAHTEERREKNLNDSVLEAFEAGLEKLNRLFPNFVFGGTCTLQNNTTRLDSNYGLKLSSSAQLSSWYYMYQRKGSGSMMDGYFGYEDNNCDISGAID